MTAQRKVLIGLFAVAAVLTISTLGLQVFQSLASGGETYDCCADSSECRFVLRSEDCGEDDCTNPTFSHCCSDACGRPNN